MTNEDRLLTRLERLSTEGLPVEGPPSVRRPERHRGPRSGRALRPPAERRSILERSRPD